MLPDDILDPIKQRISVEVEEEVLELLRSIEIVKRENAAKGLFKSGSTLKKATNLCCEMIKKRTEFVKNLLQTVIADSPDLLIKSSATELKVLAKSFIPENDPVIIKQLTDLTSIIQKPELLPQLLAQVNDRRTTLLAKFESEIDLFFYKHKPISKIRQIALQAITAAEFILILGSIWYAIIHIRHAVSVEPQVALLIPLAALLEWSRKRVGKAV